MNATERWKPNLIRQNILFLELSLEREFPLPSRERVRVRGRCKPWTPSPHSSPVKGEEVEQRKNVALGLTLSLVLIFAVVFAALVRVGSAAEGTRFLASYGGTAG
jgi:hypothetical protein